MAQPLYAIERDLSRHISELERIKIEMEKNYLSLKEHERSTGFRQDEEHGCGAWSSYETHTVSAKTCAKLVSQMDKMISVFNRPDLWDDLEFQERLFLKYVYKTEGYDFEKTKEKIEKLFSHLLNPHNWASLTLRDRLCVCNFMEHTHSGCES